MEIKRINAGDLEIAYLEAGPADGWPAIMCHGFPYDVQTYAEVMPALATAGARVIVPWLRGYGPTRFVSPKTMRSGEQAVLGNDLRCLMDALGIERAVLGGYDWGGRACCVVSALWPERVVALVSGNGYNIQNVARSMEPASAEKEAAYWYQYYFNMERGRLGLQRNRLDIIRLLWRMWSPRWAFDDATFEASAPSFDNPDFVEVVIHSYRVRYARAPGDPAVAHIEQALAEQPEIRVPTISIDGTASGFGNDSRAHGCRFSGPYEYRAFDDAGHNLPQESPLEWVRAVQDARALAG